MKEFENFKLYRTSLKRNKVLNKRRGLVGFLHYGKSKRKITKSVPFYGSLKQFREITKHLR